MSSKRFRHFVFKIVMMQYYCMRNSTEGRKLLFNDALNTFYLQLYGVGHMMKDLSAWVVSLLPPLHELLFPSNSKGYFTFVIPDRSTYHGLCYSSCGALTERRNNSMGLTIPGGYRVTILKIVCHFYLLYSYLFNSTKTELALDRYFI